MAIVKTTVTSMTALVTWLAENAPEYGTWSNPDVSTLILIVNDEQRFIWNASLIRIRKSTSTFEDITVSQYDSPNYSGGTIVAKCAGGIMITRSVSNGFAHIILTKTNNNELAIICVVKNGSSTAYVYKEIHSVAYGDETDSTKLISFTPTSQNQTQFVPFTTYAVADATSYTPNAYYLPTTQYASIGYGKISDGVNNYITNGYWAIMDKAFT